MGDPEPKEADAGFNFQQHFNIEYTAYIAGRKIVFSYGFVRDSDMEAKMKKFVLDMCVSNLEKFSDNSTVRHNKLVRYLSTTCIARER